MCENAQQKFTENTRRSLRVKVLYLLRSGATGCDSSQLFLNKNIINMLQAEFDLYFDEI